MPIEQSASVETAPNMSYCPLRLEDYDISPVHGFLPTQPPLRRLTDLYYEPWESIMDKFNHYLLGHHIRRLVREMPILSTDKLSTQAEYQRAFTILSFMAHAFVWGRNGAASEPASELNPVVCCAAVCHWNWQVLDENAEDLMSIDNLGTLHTFTGSMDESWFYLVTIAIEAKCAPGLNAILSAISGVESNDIQQVTQSLVQISQALREANYILERMYENCDPYIFYWKIREFLAGWENMADAGLPYGVLYEGVDDTDTFSLDNWQSLIRRFRKYAGGSAAQTPLLQAFDIALGIKHYPTGKRGKQSSVEEARRTLREQGISEPPPANSYLVRMRDYMPGGHRHFLQDLAETCRIREYVLLKCSDSLLHTGFINDARVLLRKEYNSCLEMMRSFREKHIMMVTRYIIAPARNGSSVFVPAVAPVSSHVIPPEVQTQAFAHSFVHPPPGGRLGGDSLPADPTMYPQTNKGGSGSLKTPPDVHSRSVPQTPSPSREKARLARTVNDDSVIRGTGGTDAIQFLKQVRNETAQSRV